MSAKIKLSAILRREIDDINDQIRFLRKKRSKIQIAHEAVRESEKILKKDFTNG